MDFLPDPDKIYGPQDDSDDASDVPQSGRKTGGDDDEDDDDGDESGGSELDMRRIAGNNYGDDDDGFNSCDYDENSTDEDAEFKPISLLVFELRHCKNWFSIIVFITATVFIYLVKIFCFSNYARGMDLDHVFEIRNQLAGQRIKRSSVNVYGVILLFLFDRGPFVTSECC